MVAAARQAKLVARTVLVEPFDISLHATRDGEGLLALQNRIAMWLRGLQGPARFIVWQMPADLGPRIEAVAAQARASPDPARRQLLMEYRRHYELLQHEAQYQRAVCGLCTWTEPSERVETMARGVAGALDVPAWAADFPPLFEGRYVLTPPQRDYKFWHLSPVGRPGGRPHFAFLSSYLFHPVAVNFFRPMAGILRLPYPMAICVDIPKTYERNEAISAVEGMILASRVHLATSVAEDSRSAKKLVDGQLTLQQLNEGDMLHEVQIIIALAAPNRAGLKRAVGDVINQTKPYFLLRPEAGASQVAAAQYFSEKQSKDIGAPSTTWQMMSRELALFFAPLGSRKLQGLAGTLRGQSADGSYPFFLNAWTVEKRATHEVWVGLTGAGKTFALNIMLTRQYVEEGVPFDLLEPMGHGKILADALGLPWFVPSPTSTRLNPLDVMYPTPTEQITHVIRLTETLLGRTFAGDQLGNHQKALVGRALVGLYGRWTNLDDITPEVTPVVSDLCEALAKLGDKSHTRKIARDLADEIGGLCTGAGPYAAFVDERTNLDLSFRGREWPRVFSFHEMASDPELLAIAYTQVLTAIRRDSLADESPRAIAVDEVYRLMRHPSLLDFLIEAVKTFRTRRKKVCVVDQQMSIFMTGKARLVFENCPIRVIFNQRSGLHVFKEDPAFSHFTPQHHDIIASLQRGYYLLDIQDVGVYYLFNRPSQAEYARFAST